jgi:hypothetical protein
MRFIISFVVAGIKGYRIVATYLPLWGIFRSNLKMRLPASPGAAFV